MTNKRNKLNKLIHIIKALVDFKHILIGGYFFVGISLLTIVFSILVRILGSLIVRK